jgi:hypothetical protein
MGFPTPCYSRNQVNNAGSILTDLGNTTLDREQLFWAFDVVTNWRSCHGYPINTFQATLRQKLGSVDADAIVAQRLKRMPSEAVLKSMPVVSVTAESY